MVAVNYYRNDEHCVIYQDDDAEFVPEPDDTVCIPPDDDPSNEYTGGWTTFTVTDRRYKVAEDLVICYVE